jgi:hypothetical protein
MLKAEIDFKISEGPRRPKQVFNRPFVPETQKTQNGLPTQIFWPKQGFSLAETEAS